MDSLVKILLFAAFHIVFVDASIAEQTVRAMIHRNSRDIGTIMEDVKLLTANGERMEQSVQELRNDVANMRVEAAESRANENALKVELLQLIEQKLQGSNVKHVLHGTMNFPRNCVDIKENGQTTSGVYTVYMPEDGDVSHNPVLKPVTVYCDMDTEGGGWLLILNRVDANYFDHTKTNWEQYEEGFGATSKSHWLGNKFISGITGQMQYSLKIVLEDFEGQSRYADYKYFRVGPKESDYRLFISGYRGNAGDGLSAHDGMRFSTPDYDRDIHNSNCARTYKGGWWFAQCHTSMLTGEYFSTGTIEPFAQGVNWKLWRGYHYSLRKAKMMIKPVDHSN